MHIDFRKAFDSIQRDSPLHSHGAQYSSIIHSNIATREASVNERNLFICYVWWR